MDFKSTFNKVIILVLVLAVLAGAYFLLSSMGGINNPQPTPTVQVSTVTPVPSVAAPKISLIVLTVPECRDCFDVDAISFVLQQNGVDLNIEKFPYNSSDGAALVAQYSVKKLPTIIFSGEISKVPQLEGLLQVAGDEVGGKWVLRDIAPPYLDLDEGRVIGKVSVITVYDKNCFNCRDATVPISSAAVNYSELGETFREVGIGISQDIEYEANSTQGREIIAKYNITRLPVIVLSKDIEAYPELSIALANISTKEEDGNYVLRKINPPYMDIASGEEMGLLTIIYLKAGSSCDPDCYDYTIHRTALLNLGVSGQTEYFYDYDSFLGKNLTSTYNITKVPTILISPEVKDYPAFMAVYKQIGDFEKDGWFVFRNFNVLEGAWYFDLLTNSTSTQDPNAAIQITGGSLPVG
ncbi:MAG: hypothetical protein ABH863_03715 [Candidatus Micrarchaeota archaeon]